LVDFHTKLLNQLLGKEGDVLECIFLLKNIRLGILKCGFNDVENFMIFI